MAVLVIVGGIPGPRVLVGGTEVRVGNAEGVGVSELMKVGDDDDGVGVAVGVKTY